MADFKAALPRPIKWSTGENKYDTTGKQPTSLSLFVPLESAAAFAQHIIEAADDAARHKAGKVWDYEAKAEVEVTGIYINGKGRDGNYGSYGTINPQAGKPVDPAAMPF